MNVNTVVKRMTLAVILLVGTIALFAFILSYGALLAVGHQNGMPGDWRGLLWPLLTDLALTVSTLALLVAQITRQDTRWWVAGVVFLSLASMGYNVAHAPLVGKAGVDLVLVVAVNVWPPLMLVMSTEALRHILRVGLDRQGMVTTMTELGQQKATLERQVAELSRTAEGTGPDPVEQRKLAKARRERLKDLEKEGITSVSELARLEEVSETTIRRDLARISQNGHGGR